MVEQSFQIMLRHHPLLAALLKQEASDGHLDHSVLVPLRMTFDESAHGVIKILRQLVFHTDVWRHGIWSGQQIALCASFNPSPHVTSRFVKTVPMDRSS